jgi:hypothetical protein
MLRQRPLHEKTNLSGLMFPEPMSILSSRRERLSDLPATTL